MRRLAFPGGAAFSLLYRYRLLSAFVVNSEITFKGAYFSSNYLRHIGVQHQTALTQNIRPASLGTPIDLLAGNRAMTKTGTQTHRGNTSSDIPPINMDHTRPCHFSLPPLRPPPGVIPAQAGILTRDVIYKGHTVVNNHAGTPSRHQLNTECKDLCVLQPLVWIRTICRSRRPYPD